jgi:hypothetical protein
MSRPATAAGDGLGLAGAGERHDREHGSQCHEQAEHGFRLSFSMSRGNVVQHFR